MTVVERTATRTWIDALDEAFFATTFERAPLVVRGAHGGDLAAIVSLDALEAVLASPRGARHSYVRLGKVLADGTWDVVKLAPEIPPAHMIDRYRAGYTLLVDEVDTRLPAIAEQCALLHARCTRLAHVAMAARATCGLFLSPPHAQGTRPHYDCKDVFVLQIAGVKTWRLHAPPLAAPVRNSGETDVDPATLGEPVLEATLEPGDLLYMPRGFVHAPRAGEAHALHLSFGVATIAWRDVLAAMLVDRPFFRRAIPRAGVKNDAVLRAYLAEALAALDDPADAARAFRRATMGAVVADGHVPGGLLADGDVRGAAIADDVPLAKRYGERYVVERIGAEIAVAFPGRVVGVPAAAEAAVARLLADDAVTIAQLAEHVDAALARSATERLIDAGFLQVAERARA